MPTKSAEARKRYRRAKKDRNLAAGLTSKGTPRKPPRVAAAPRKLTPEQWIAKKAATAARSVARNRAWRKANSEVCRAIEKTYRQKTPSKQREKALARTTATSQATPPWLTPEHRRLIDNWYHLGRAIGYHVDHIIPLRGENVSGLHVPWNLQTLHPVENLRKSNRYAFGNNTYPS